MASSTQSLPVVGTPSRHSLTSASGMRCRCEEPSPLVDVDSPLNSRLHRVSADSTGTGRAAFPSVSHLSTSKSRRLSKPSTSELNGNLHATQQSLLTYSTLFDRSELTSGLVPSQSSKAGRLPILSSTEESQQSAGQTTGRGSPLVARLPGALLRSHSKESRHTRGSSPSRRPNQSSGRKGSVSHHSGSGIQGSEEMGTSSFSAVQASVSRQPSIGWHNGSAQTGSDNFGTSLSSPASWTVGGRRHSKATTGSEAGQLPMVSVDVNALNMSRGEDPFNTSRTLREARAVLRRKRPGSFRLGTSRTVSSGLSSSLARRGSLNNRTISFVGADEDSELYSLLPSDGPPTPTSSPRQRTRIPGAGSSLTMSTGRAPSGTSGGADYSGSGPPMERANTESPFLFQADNGGGSYSRSGERHRNGWANTSRRSGSRHRNSSEVGFTDSDDADAELHDRKFQTLLQHLSRRGFTTGSRRTESTHTADLPNGSLQDGDVSPGGSPRFGFADDHSPLNNSISTSFTVFSGGWSALGGGESSAVTSNDWYARMRMKASQASDDDDAVQHPQHTPLPRSQVGGAASIGERDSVPIPVPPAQCNLSPSPKAKLGQTNKDAFMQPPTPLAHARDSSSSDHTRATLNGSHTAESTLTTVPAAMAASLNKSLNTPTARVVVSGTVSDSRHNNLGSSATPAKNMTAAAAQERPRHGSGGDVPPVSLTAGSTSEVFGGHQRRLSQGQDPAESSSGSATAAVAEKPTTATAPARAAYRRSSRRSHPSASMPALGAAVITTAAMTPQYRKPRDDNRTPMTATAETERTDPATRAASPKNPPPVAQPGPLVRPLSGAFVASARSPFKSSSMNRHERADDVSGTTLLRSVTAEASAEPDRDPNAKRSAPTAKALRRSSAADESSGQPDSAHTTPGRSEKASGYAAVRRQSVSIVVPPATAAPTVPVAHYAVPDPPPARHTVLAQAKTPTAPTTRRTTVRRLSSQATSVEAQPNAGA